MKKLAVIVCCCLTLFGCVHQERTPLKDTIASYPQEVAVEENCVVVEDHEFVHGEELWNNFFKKTNDGTYGEIRIVVYSTDYTISQTTPLHHTVIDLVFNGNTYEYKMVCDEWEDIEENKYQYLLKDYDNNQTIYYVDSERESYLEGMTESFSSISEVVNSFKVLFKIKN